jgi:hypothetical protein
MDDKKIFTDGMIVKAPRDGAPEYVKCSISIKTEAFTAFLENHTKPDGWVNIDVKVGQSGKWYGQLDQWTKDTPIKRSTDEEIARSIPF